MIIMELGTEEVCYDIVVNGWMDGWFQDRQIDWIKRYSRYFC